MLLHRRHVTLASSVALALLVAAPASALNDLVVRSCDPTCESKPPKERLFIRAGGDFAGTGMSPEISGTLASGIKKSIVRVDLTYEWLSSTTTTAVRPLTVRVNDRPTSLFSSFGSSCRSETCVVHTVWWFDVDQLESSYPGEFHGKPLKVDLESSVRATDDGQFDFYQLSMAIEVAKKK